MDPDSVHELSTEVVTAVAEKLEELRIVPAS